MTSGAALPSGWEELALGQLAHLERGKFSARPRNDPKYYGGTIPFIQTGDVRNSGGRIASHSQTLNRRGLKVSKLFPSGTLFMTIAANIGDLGITEFASACPDSLVAIRPRAGVHQRWLYYALSAEKRVLESIATQNAQANLNLAKLHPFLLRVPPHNEQAAIADALSSVGTHITALERLIAKKVAIMQGVLQQLLTGKIRLPGFGESWQPLAVASESVIKARIGWQGLKTDEYRDNGTHRLVGGTEFVDGRIDWDQAPFVDKWRYDQDPYIQLRRGDVLLTKDGSIGKTAYVEALPGPATLNSGVFVIRPIRGAYDSHFLFFLLRSRAFLDFLARLSAGSTISHLYQRDLLTLVLDVPPTVDEQRSIALALSECAAEIDMLRVRQAKAQAVKVGMMQELLTGRTRLHAEVTS